MLNDIPDEILRYIINKSCNNPKDYIYFKNINKRCFNIITSFENLYQGKENTYENEINDLCIKQTSIKDFEWLFKNDVIFTLQNIKQLIIHNRVDVFKKGLFYSTFLDILFNRFYIPSSNIEDIFTIVEINNPLLVAGTYNRIEIIKLLVEKSTIGNPYINCIPSLLDLSIKYNKKNLLSYLIINQPEEITKNIDNRLLSIIHRIQNCEDILFHLFINKKIKLYSKHIDGLIIKHYNALFKYWYKTKNKSNYNRGYLSQCVAHNNVELFNFIFEKHKNTISKLDFSNILFENRRSENYLDKKLFIYNLLNNYREYIDKDSILVNICILNDIEEQSIIQLIHEGYTYNHDDMVTVLKRNQILLLEKMCRKINEVID